MLRLKGGEFAIGMWVVAELTHLLVNLDTLVRGETGTSLIELNVYSIETRRALTYWSALAAMIGLLALVFWLLRTPLGAAIQAIRDNEEAAELIGVRFAAVKRLVFVLAAFGAALAGALWVATALTFQPKAYFSPHLDSLHDLHGAGRRPRHVRGRDPRRRRSSLPSRPGSATPASGISSASARRRSSSRSSFRAGSGAG